MGLILGNVLAVSKLPLFAFGSETLRAGSVPDDEKPPADFFLNTLLIGQVWGKCSSSFLFSPLN